MKGNPAIKAGMEKYLKAEKKEKEGITKAEFHTILEKASKPIKPESD